MFCVGRDDDNEAEGDDGFADWGECRTWKRIVPNTVVEKKSIVLDTVVE